MATGIPPKDKKKAGIVPICLSYEGKIANDEILQRRYAHFQPVTSINQGKENSNEYIDDTDSMIKTIDSISDEIDNL